MNVVLPSGENRMYSSSEINNNTSESPLIEIYPNPTIHEVYITYNSLDCNIDNTLQLINLEGRIVKSIVLTREKGMLYIDLSSYSSGTYVILLTCFGEIISEKKLIIQ